MIDYQSVNSIVSQLSKVHKELGSIFPLDMNAPKTAKFDTVLLARHGYLGMLAIARQKADRYALRIVPDLQLDRSRVVNCTIKDHLATTIAPSMKDLVPGAISYNVPRHKAITELMNAEIVRLSNYFGDKDHITSVLNYMGSDLDDLDTMDARSVLYSVCGDDPWFHVLSQVWKISRKDAALWSEKIMQDYPDILIPWRISTSYHVLARDNIDVREAAWRLVLADDVVDAAYSGRAIGQWSSWTGRPLIAIVRWLENQDMQAYMQRYLGLWQAAQAFAHDPVGYDGRLHLAFAQQVAAEDPKLAYTHAANAAFYFSHATGQMPAESIIFAHELAQQQQWEHLYHVLQWVREDAHI